MKHNYLLIAVLFFSFFVGQAQEKKETPFSFKWDNGFKLESADKEFKLKFGGRIMVDHAYLFQNDDLDTNFGPLESKSGAEFRRARLFMSGTIYSNIDFKLQVDFAGGEISLKDAYVGLRDIPGVGNIRVGHVKEPFRLDALTSSKYITFMERALPVNASQERNTGIIAFNDFLGKRLSVQAGAFRNSDESGNDIGADDGYALTGRVTGLALNNSKKKQLVHLGVGYSFRKPESKELKISIRPEAHLAPKYTGTGTIEGIDNTNLINFEGAAVFNSFSIQGEYLMATVKTIDDSPFDSYNFSFYYGQVSYFLTGESKNYKSSYSGFNRVKPKKNFGKSKGIGAWEVAVRYSNTNLNSKDILGGEQSDITIGTNWYINPATRLMVNYVFADIKDLGKASVLQARMQIDF